MEGSLPALNIRKLKVQPLVAGQGYHITWDLLLLYKSRGSIPTVHTKTNIFFYFYYYGGP